MFDCITIEKKVMDDIRKSDEVFGEYSENALQISLLEEALHSLDKYTLCVLPKIEQITICPTDGSVRNFISFYCEFGRVINAIDFVRANEDGVVTSFGMGLLLRAHIDFVDGSGEDYYFMYA